MCLGVEDLDLDLGAGHEIDAVGGHGARPRGRGAHGARQARPVSALELDDENGHDDDLDDVNSGGVRSVGVQVEHAATDEVEDGKED